MEEERVEEERVEEERVEEERVEEQGVEEQRVTGTVKWFSDRKGYGFITREEGKDVFVHFSSIRGGGHRSLNEGDKVEFAIESDDRGLKAADLVVLEAAPGGRSDSW